jgi:RES domain
MTARPQPPVSPLTFPYDGAVRVHPEPAALARLRREGPGRNRFDDPDGQFLIRYAADTLHGCLVETMARLRPHPETEAVLAAITDVDDEEPRERAYADPSLGIADWLTEQHIGQLQIMSSDPLLVDVEHATMLDALDAHPDVRRALDQSGLGTSDDPSRLDAGIIRLSGPVGRPITQSVSRAIYEWISGVDGIGYWSRLDSTERCWAIYDHAPVRVAVLPLDPQVTSHREAVRAVATRYGIPLPADWR